MEFSGGSIWMWFEISIFYSIKTGSKISFPALPYRRTIHMKDFRIARISFHDLTWHISICFRKASFSYVLSDVVNIETPPTIRSQSIIREGNQSTSLRLMRQFLKAERKWHGKPPRLATARKYDKINTVSRGVLPHQSSQSQSPFEEGGTWLMPWYCESTLSLLGAIVFG